MPKNVCWLAFLLFPFLATRVPAGSSIVVSPERLDLLLEDGETVTEQVTFTTDVYCITPFELDVVASDPEAMVTNLSGVLLNGCGGDLTSFDIELIGTGAPQQFDLQFVSITSGSIVRSIPVTITPTIHPCTLSLTLEPRRTGFTLGFELDSGPAPATWGSALWIAGTWVSLFEIDVPAEFEYEQDHMISIPPPGPMFLVSWVIDGDGEFVCLEMVSTD